MKRMLMGCALIGLAPALAMASHGTFGDSYGQRHVYLSSHQVQHRSSGVSVSIQVGSHTGTHFRYTQRSHYGPTFYHMHTRQVYVAPPVVYCPPPVVIYQTPRYVAHPPVRRHVSSGLRYSHPYDSYHYYRR